MDPFSGAILEYVIQRSLHEILKQLRRFVQTFSSDVDLEEKSVEELSDTLLPSSAIIGIGRCGSNISMFVADIFSKANENDILDETDSNKQSLTDNSSFIQRLFNNQGYTSKISPISMVDPIIIIADLDEDTFDRISPKMVENYPKLKLLSQLSELQGGGAGNIPVLGQYIGRMAFNIRLDAQSILSSSNWILNRTYFIDSAGAGANKTRLFFYVFSTGGGSGSGMTPEFGLVQQFAYFSKIRKPENFQESIENDDDTLTYLPEKFIRFQPICSLGIGVLPNVEANEANNALYINSGRALCRFLSHEFRFGQYFTNDETVRLDARNLRTFNGLMLVSNDVMKWETELASEAKGGRLPQTSVAEAEQKTNHYIAQQIFNLLTAQAIGAEHTPDNEFKSAGIDAGDTIRLDANDLNNSINGPIVVAYAESILDGFNSQDLLIRSLSVPRKNQNTGSLEGISILPATIQTYQEFLEEGRQNLAKLADIPLFKHADSIVTVISVPEDYPLAQKDLIILKNGIVQLFPNADIKRYALVKGATTAQIISFTIFISGSGCLCPETFAHIQTYIRSCFSNSKKEEAQLPDLIAEAIKSPFFERDKIRDMLSDIEKPEKVLAGYNAKGHWEAIKIIHEANFKALQGLENFTPIETAMLTKEDILDALEYLNKSFNHAKGNRVMPTDIFM